MELSARVTLLLRLLGGPLQLLPPPLILGLVLGLMHALSRVPLVDPLPLPLGLLLGRELIQALSLVLL